MFWVIFFGLFSDYHNTLSTHYKYMFWVVFLDYFQIAMVLCLHTINICFGLFFWTIFRLPWYFVYVAYLLVMVVIGTCSYFVMLYGLKYGYHKSLAWLVSFVTSVFNSACVAEPVKVLAVALMLTLVFKSAVEYDSGKIKNVLGIVFLSFSFTHCTSSPVFGMEFTFPHCHQQILRLMIYRSLSPKCLVCRGVSDFGNFKMVDLNLLSMYAF